MKKPMKIVGKVFKRNMLIISTVVTALAILSVGFYIIQNDNALEKQIMQIEQQSLSDIVTGSNNAFNQVADICSFYANIKLADLADSYNDENYHDFTVMQKQVDAAKSVYSPINIVDLSKGDINYRVGAMSTRFDMKSEEATNYGAVKSSQICEVTGDDGKGHVFFRYNLEGRNNVYVSVDSYQIAKQIFKEQKSLRNDCIVDRNGIVIFSLKSSYVGKSVWDIYSIKRDIKNVDAEMVEANGREYFLSAEQLPNLDLYAVCLADKTLYSSYFSQSVLTTVILCIVFVVLTATVATIILIVTYKPIKNIFNEINKYAPSIDLYNKDEVKYITEITRNLFVENKELNVSVYERANEIRRNQIKMLQAQICPHFICNTLDAMNWLTYGYVKELDNPLSQTIQNMSSILENNLDLSTMFTTVGEEIKITERYADIINVRYQDAIDIKWDIDESVLDCVIMKLCIQPLIENAASHGLVGIDRRGEITISVKEKGEDIEITVSDNGVGMEKEYLDELLESINNFEKINSSKNIGLRNINHRLRLLYGEDYKLSIESRKDKGTVCSFRILKSVLEIE